ncbi:MAG TPA: hypothetical protein VFR52_01730, partial [Sphingomicrobium sp.]|nr:hypothetical protein [Sphingomicrobium sp.]
MFAAKISLARLKTGPLNQVASGVEPEFIFSGSLTSRGVLTGTFASMISSSGIGGNCDWAGDLRRTDCCADRDGAQQDRSCESSKRASEMRLTRHSKSPFFPIRLSGWIGAKYYSKGVPIAEIRQKLRFALVFGGGLAGFPTQAWRRIPIGRRNPVRAVLRSAHTGRR